MEPATQEQPVREPRPPEQPLQPPADRPPATSKTSAGKKSNWRHRKAQLLPEITQLALEGHSGRSIALRLDVPIRSVNYLLKELRRQWLAAAAQTSAEMMSLEFARLNNIYREAMEAWRRSETEVQAWFEEWKTAGEARTANDTKPPRRNAALLRGALAALRQVREFRDRATPRPAAGTRRPPAMPRPSGDLENLSEEELLALEARCGLLDKDGPHPDPLPEGEESCSDSPHPDPLPKGEGSCSK